jgi:phospholipid:diacylglycerol acyltransferase
MDAVLASTGLNVSSLSGLTDTLTDTITDLSDTFSATWLTVTVRGLLAQLPAFGVPGPSAAGGGAGAAGGAGSTDTSGLRPGLAMARRGYRAKHPVVIVPGRSGWSGWSGCRFRRTI